MPELPPIREEAILDATQFVAALQAIAAEAQRAADAQNELLAALKATQEALDSMAAGAAEAAAADARLAEEEASVAAAAEAGAVAVEAAASADRDLAASAAEAVAALQAMRGLLADIRGSLNAMAADAVADSAMIAAAVNRVTDAVNGLAADSAIDSAVVIAALNRIGDAVTGTAAKSAAAGAAAAAGFRLWGTGIRLTGTALHWIVAGTFEFLAVAIPALVALGAGMAVAAQGAQNAYNHFQALYTATEATANVFHQTIGTTLGLGDALQTAQNQANPGVYELLGSAINDMKGNFTGLQGQLLTTQSGFAGLAQTGLDVVHTLDEFAARVTVDLGTGLGSQVHGLLSGMVTDLTEFGQILGNVGHAVLNFAAAMPGLAGFLLAVATAVSHVVLAISSIPAPIITAVMAIEEFYRWGGLAMNAVLGLGAAFSRFIPWLTQTSFIAKFGQSLLSLVQYGGVAVQWAGQMITRLGTLIGVSGEAGAAVQAFGVAMTRLAISPIAMAGIAGLVAGLGLLVVAAARGQTAMQQWISASDAAVSKASDLNVLNTIGEQLAATQVRLTAATEMEAAAQAHAAGEAHALVERWVSTSEGAALASENIVNLTAHEQSLIDTGVRVIQNAAQLGAVFHTSASGAMALANAAGVNLQQAMAKGTEAFAIAVQQIRNYIAGIGAMGAPMGVLGADVMALGIQSQLAATKVQQLNQAWDAWIQTTTSAASSMSQVQTALGQMGAGAKSASADLSGTISSVSKASSSVAGFRYTLQGFGPAAMQSWQQFTSAINTGNGALDTLRTGMAEGVVSGGQFKTTVQGLVGEMLKYTQGNGAAVQMLSQLAHEAGGPITSDLKTLAQWAGVAGNTARNQFAKGMLDASLAMGNMAKVAQNLSAVVFGSMNKAMGTAIVANSGLNTAIQKYATDMKNAHAPAGQLAADQHNIASAMERANAMIAKSSDAMSKATQQADVHAAAAAKDAASTADSASKVADQAAAASRAEEAVKAHALAMQGAASAASGMSSKVSSLNGQVATAASTQQRLNAQVQAGGNMAHTAAAAVTGLHTAVDSASSAASTAAGRMASLGSDMARAGGEASAAAGEVRGLASAIAALQSKTITITTNMVTSVSHRAGGGPVAAGVPYLVGEAGQEMFIPSQNGMILPAPVTQQIMSGGGGGGQAPSGPQVIQLEAVLHHQTVMPDGRVLADALHPYVLRFEKRNGFQWTQSRPHS